MNANNIFEKIEKGKLFLISFNDYFTTVSE
jgi:hypothetical protein